MSPIWFSTGALHSQSYLTMLSSSFSCKHDPEVLLKSNNVERNDKYTETTTVFSCSVPTDDHSPACQLPFFLIHHPPSFSLRVIWTRLHFGLYPFLLPGVLLSVVCPPRNASCGVMARHGVGRHKCHLVSNVPQSKRLVRVNQVVQWSLAKSARGEAFLYHGQLQWDGRTKNKNKNSHLAPPKLTIQ